MTDRTVTVRLRGDIADFQRKWAAAGATTSVFVKQLDTADSRMGNLVQTALALAPAFVPISAAATPALVGLTSQLGFAAAGVGVLVSAMNGVGDTLGAVNDYQLEPTNANLQKMQEAIGKLPKDGREFVRFLDSEVLPALDRLQDVAAEGALDGVQDGIDDLLTRLPQVRRIVSDLAEGAGTIASDMGEGLASDEFDEFFRFLKAEAQPTLVTFGRTVGNVFDGLATTLIGLNPLANDFEAALLDWSRGFADIDPDDFAEFVAYVRDVGPDAVDALGAVGGALVAIVKATSPVGEVALPVIEALAQVIETVAESPAGPVLIATAAGLSAVSRAVALFNAANGSAIAGFLGKAGKDGAAAGLGMRGAAAGLGVLALAYTDLDDKAGLSNTTMLATMGLMAGPWGAAIGATAGAILDIKSANDDMNASFEATRDVIRSGTFDERREELRRLREEIEEFESFEFAGDSGRGLFGDLKGEIALIGDAFTGANAKRKQFVDELRTQRGTGDLGTIYAQGLGIAADAFDHASQSADEFRESLAAVNRALDGRANLRDYQAALDDFTDSVKENGRTLDIGTEKGRSNQAALDNIAVTALSVAENFKGMNRVRVLDQAREDFLDAARKLRIPQDEAERLATKLGLLDQQKVKPTIDVDDKPAKRKLKEAQDGLELWDAAVGEAKAEVDGRAALAALLGLEGKMNALDGKTSNLYVTTTLRTVRQGSSGPQDPSGSWAGSTVPKDGGPYTDRFPYMLAPGEEVISNRNGQADRNRSLLKAINAGRMAGGGTVGSRAGSAEERLGVLQAAQAIRELIRSLKADGKNKLGPNAREIAKVELEAARAQLKAAEANLGAAVRGKEAEAAEALLSAASLQLDAAESQQDAAQSMLDSLLAQRDSYASSVAGNFDNDIFGNGLAGAMLQLEADANDANTFKNLLASLSGAGLDGGAFGALAASGDLLTAEQLFAGGLGSINAFESSFGARATAQDAVGGFAADQQFGAQLAAQTLAVQQQTFATQEQAAAVMRMENRLALLEGAVERGAERGTRAGNNDRNQDTKQRGKAGR